MTPGRIEASRVSTSECSRSIGVATYQRNAVRLAADRMKSDIVRELQTAARRLFFSAIGLDAGDRQFLQDFARGEGRYQMIALCRLIAISSQSVKPEDREAIPEIIRGWILRPVAAAYDVGLAFDLETRAQGEADVAQRLFERQPSRGTREVAIEKLTLHHHALRASLDAVAAHRS